MASASCSAAAAFGPRPQVRLVNAFDAPFDNAVATARTCYAPRVITPEEVSVSERARAQRDAIARSTYEAGHHTTLQHAHFQFVLENVSRQFLWSFLHAHPYYNSEQVSQRYVKVTPGHVFIPHLPQRCQKIYRATIDAQMGAYTALVELLQPPCGDAYFQIFPARRKKSASYAGAIRKKAQEEARYVLPVATYAHLYHTISGLTLHRYHRLSHALDVPAESRAVVEAMVGAVRAHDPLFLGQLEDALPLEETHEAQMLQHLGQTAIGTDAAAFVRAFDAQLAGKKSILIDYSARSEQTLARAVRTVLGLLPDVLPDDDAISAVLSPSHNKTLGGALNLTSLGKLSRALTHVHYTFAKKLSHTADSQDQRHRTTLGSRPILQQVYAGGEPDVVVPTLIDRVPEARALFMQTMRITWQAIDQLLDAQVSPADALYLLPNAFPIRFEQSGDLLGLHHKWTSRLCYNAQEEIWQASRDEVEAVRAVHPRIGTHLLPPCALRDRAKVRPICPEGPRFCGVAVWKQDVSAYERLL